MIFNLEIWPFYFIQYFFTTVANLKMTGHVRVSYATQTQPVYNQLVCE